MMLWALGSMHSPHHAPDEYIIRYRGKFDMGWDKARVQLIFNPADNNDDDPVGVFTLRSNVSF